MSTLHATGAPAHQDVLRQSEETFRLLVDSVKDYAIFMLDPRGHIVTWNAGAMRITGYLAEDIIGKHFSVFYTPADVQRNWPAYEIEIATRDGRYEEEGIRVRQDGSHFFAVVVITPVYGPAGDLRGFAKVTRDITERKHAEEALKASEEALRKAHDQLERRVEERTMQLAQVNEELESFCYSVSHDLRAPLRGMQGFAAALEEDYGDQLDTTAKEYLHRISRAAKRMESLIHDLLDYSRLSREHVPLQPLNLHDVVDDAMAHVGGEIAQRHASVSVEPPLPPVRANRGVLVRVLTNLLSNAIKFVEPGTTPVVKLYAIAEGEKVRVFVQDNGLGIKREHEDRIFRIFERLHGVDKYSGTGIGLAIVRKGMERMDGAAGVESEPGRGSLFWIELPFAGAAQ